MVKFIHFDMFTKHLMKEISFHMSLDFILILPTSQNNIEIFKHFQYWEIIRKAPYQVSR